MPTSALDTTVGGANSNAYVDIATADQYHLDHPTLNGQDWSVLNATQKAQGIIAATRLLDSMFEWRGWAVSATQVLLWPRFGLLTTRGFALDYNSIPRELQWACAELARQLFTEDRTADSDIESKGITSLSAGPVSLSFKDEVYAKPIPDMVVNLIPRQWGYLKGEQSFRELVRG